MFRELRAARMRVLLASMPPQPGTPYGVVEAAKLTEQELCRLEAQLRRRAESRR